MSQEQTLYHLKLHPSLSLRFSFLVIAFSTLFLVLSTALQLLFEYRSDVALIHDNVQFILE